MSGNKWIAVEDRLPEPLEQVVVFHRPFGETSIRIEWLTCDGDWIYARAFGPVTHWMPLPEPPKEGKYEH